MSLNARAIALQGIGFGLLLVATQGFAPVAVEKAPVAIVAPGGGGTSMAAYYDDVDAQVRRQILEEDEIIVTAVFNMIANGVLG
jgi:hypothetical protein